MERRLDAIMEIMDTAFDPMFGEAWNRSQLADAMRTRGTHCLLATEDECLSTGDLHHDPASGFLLSRAAPGEEEILLLGVRPEHRRRGVASRLIAEFKREAAARGAERLFLEMRANNPAASFYSGHDFVPIGKRRNYYRQNDGTYLDAITYAHDISLQSPRQVL